MELDIKTAVNTAIILAVIGLIFSLFFGIRSIRKARTLKFFRMRRDRMVRGWRQVFFAFILGILVLLTRQFAEPLAYTIYPPSPTVTLTTTITPTPTITLTPTITQTPTITLTPEFTDTPTITPTPGIPLAIEILFESQVTPNPDALFSPLVFTQGIDNFEPLNPGEVFENPLSEMHAIYSYDGMVEGSQWTALWYHNGDLVHFETNPWRGSTGGWGFTNWDPEAHEWLPGEYKVQIFVGNTWKVSGRFTVEGDPPTPVPSATLTITPSLTPTITITPSPTLTRTPAPTPTITPTNTRWPTATPITPTSTWTPWPTATSPPTNTPQPTATLTPTLPPID